MTTKTKKPAKKAAAAKPKKAPPPKKPAKKKPPARPRIVAVTQTVAPPPYAWELPRVQGTGTQVVAHKADTELFMKLAAGAMNAARAMADLQNRGSVLPFSHEELSFLLGKLGRAPDPVTLTAREASVLAELLAAANRTALMLPGYSDKELAVHGLVTMLLNCANLLEEAALRAGAAKPTAAAPTGEPV